jgi:hypothetical protein
MRERVLIGLATLILLGGSVLWLLSPPRPRLTGTLPAQDLVDITDTVRREMGQQPKILPDFSWASIRQLPRAVRHRWSDRILSIDVADDGSVEVRAGGAKRGTTYMLKKGTLRWEVISRRFWQSVSVTLRPNKTRGCVKSAKTEIARSTSLGLAWLGSFP